MTNVGYFDWEKKPRKLRHFSEEFKRSKVRELEKRITSIADICRTYEVNRSSINKWIYKYSAMAKKQLKVVVEAKSDTQKIKALEERIKELERIVGQKQLLLEFKDKMIEIAEETYGVDIKKKIKFQTLVWYHFYRKDHKKRLSSLFEVVDISNWSTQ